MTKRLEKQIAELREQVALLTDVVDACGLPTSPWVSPEAASKLIGVSRQRIRDEIALA